MSESGEQLTTDADCSKCYACLCCRDMALDSCKNGSSDTHRLCGSNMRHAVQALAWHGAICFIFASTTLSKPNILLLLIMIVGFADAVKKYVTDSHMEMQETLQTQQSEMER